MEKLVIGTRGSALALAQTEIAKTALLAVDASLSIEVRIIKTEGDTNQNPIPLDTIGKGWFTKEIEQELLSGGIDIAVHSLKDMAEDQPGGLTIGAYFSREEPRDVLVTKDLCTLTDLKAGAVIGTDSVRRKSQVLALRGDVEVKSVRGNVPTRLEKLDRGEYDALIIAAAGLLRLGLEERIAQYFSIQEMTPAPGQGILAAQVRASDRRTLALLEKIEESEAVFAALAERMFSKTVGGGCKKPVGASTSLYGEEAELVGMIATGSSLILRESIRGRRETFPDAAESLAKRLLAKLPAHEKGA